MAQFGTTVQPIWKFNTSRLWHASNRLSKRAIGTSEEAIMAKQEHRSVVTIYQGQVAMTTLIVSGR
jgi:hypothetical protein